MSFINPQSLVHANFCRVDEEADIVPALKKDFVSAVALKRPAKTALFNTCAQNIKMKYNQQAVDEMVYEFYPKLNQRNTAADIKQRARMMAIDIQPETALMLKDELTDAIRLYKKIYAAYTGNHTPSYGEMNIVPIGGKGRVPVFHIDYPFLTAHVSVMFSRLQFINRELPFYIWKKMEKDDFKINPDIPEEMISETNIGDIVFMKGLNLQDMDANRKSACVHRSSSFIPKTGQISFNIF